MNKVRKLPSAEEIYIGLGSNLSDRYANLRQGLIRLVGHPAISLERLSSIYETEPVGYLEQPLFYNMVVKIRTALSPRELLALLHEIEAEAGRVREVRWGPRTLDLDLLLYGNRIIHEEDLIIPHPRLEERAFVLYPLAEIAPHLILPNSGFEIEVAKEKVKHQGIRRLPDHIHLL